MNELLANEPDAEWKTIAPHLDIALGELSEPDRDALLLRYFERKSAREMALRLNVSEEAAQKRVNRAVERLREFFSKRNVTVGASGLAVLISTNAVQAAPIGLLATISTGSPWSSSFHWRRCGPSGRRRSTGGLGMHPRAVDSDWNYPAPPN
jgi:hypothetical protein